MYYLIKHKKLLSVFQKLDTTALIELPYLLILSYLIPSQRDISEFTEGDSRYLAPEVMQGVVTTKADVFSLGLTILEIACHVDLPKGGTLWHQLRNGELPEPSNRSKLPVTTL